MPIIDSCTVRNTKRADKPNEDLILIDEERGLFILLDGVSRDCENGAYPNPSPSLAVSRIFAQKCHQELASVKDSEQMLTALEHAVEAANKKVREYNANNPHPFPAGTVGIIAIIKNSTLFYAYIGDCTGLIIRDNWKNIFTEKQTENVAAHKNELSTKEIRYSICNNINHPYGYGVFNGDSGALDFVRYNVIPLEKGDAVLLFTDGMEKEIYKRSAADLRNSGIADLCRSDEEGSDDKSIIRIQC